MTPKQQIQWRTLQITSTNRQTKEHRLLMTHYKSYYLSGRTTWLIKAVKMKSYAYLQKQHFFMITHLHNIMVLNIFANYFS